MSLIGDLLGYIFPDAGEKLDYETAQADRVFDYYNANLDAQTTLQTNALDNQTKLNIAQNQTAWNLQALKDAGINIGAVGASGIVPSSALSSSVSRGTTAKNAQTTPSTPQTSLEKAFTDLAKMNPKQFLSIYGKNEKNLTEKKVAFLKKALSKKSAHQYYKRSR